MYQRFIPTVLPPCTARNATRPGTVSCFANAPLEKAGTPRIPRRRIISSYSLVQSSRYLVASSNSSISTARRPLAHRARTATRRTGNASSRSLRRRAYYGRDASSRSHAMDDRMAANPGTAGAQDTGDPVGELRVEEIQARAAGGIALLGARGAL